MDEDDFNHEAQAFLDLAASSVAEHPYRLVAARQHVPLIIEEWKQAQTALGFFLSDLERKAPDEDAPEAVEAYGRFEAHRAAALTCARAIGFTILGREAPDEDMD